MLITPQEFLERTRRLGIATSTFKAAMIDITDSPSVLYQMINEGKTFYFSYHSTQHCLRYIATDEEQMEEMEDEISTDAFKLLKIIAE